MPASAPPRRLLLVLALGVAAWVGAGAAVAAGPGERTTADEPQYLMTALSLARDHDLNVADERAAGAYRPFHRDTIPQQEAPRHGGLVSPHDPLLPALLAVPVWLGGWLGAKLALAAIAGMLAAALVWVAVHRFRVPTRVAVVTVLAFSAAAPLAVYGTQIYPELPAALAVTVAIGALAGPLDRRALAIAAVALVALPWLSVKYAPVVAAFVVLAMVRIVRDDARRRAAGFACVLAAAAVLFAIAHLNWYGGLTPYASGSHFTGGEFGVVGDHPNYAGRSVRLVGLLLDRDFGLAAWQPLYLLGVAAIPALVRERPRGWALLALPLAAGWCNATFVALTMSGWWFPGRQVVVVLPCVVLAVAWWAAERETRVRGLVFGAVAGASVFAWFAAQGVIGKLTFVVGFESITYPLVNAWRVLLPDYRDAAAIDWLKHAAWLVVLAVVVVRAAHLRVVPERARRVASARRQPSGALVDA